MKILFKVIIANYLEVYFLYNSYHTKMIEQLVYEKC